MKRCLELPKSLHSQVQFSIKLQLHSTHACERVSVMDASRVPAILLFHPAWVGFTSSLNRFMSALSSSVSAFCWMKFARIRARSPKACSNSSFASQAHLWHWLHLPTLAELTHGGLRCNQTACSSIALNCVSRWSRRSWLVLARPVLLLGDISSEFCQVASSLRPCAAALQPHPSACSRGKNY